MLGICPERVLRVAQDREAIKRRDPKHLSLYVGGLHPGLERTRQLLGIAGATPRPNEQPFLRLH